jgi:hypothetical protein
VIWKNLFDPLSVALDQGFIDKCARWKRLAPASSAARLLMGTRLFSALFVAFASLIQCDGNRLLLWLAGLHLRFDV